MADPNPAERNHVDPHRADRHPVCGVTGRLIELHAGSPAENMAIDQALLESVEATGQPVLRFYTWSEPTVSMGYFQAIGDRRDHAESSGLAFVRRATGGGAIVHHRELTYSIAIPLDRSLAGPRLELYQQTHLAISEALSDFGVRAVPFRLLGRVEPSSRANPFLCFQRRTDEDLIVSGYKILGSAQRKTRQAVLQHGSLLMRASPWAPQLPGLLDLTSRQISLAELAGSCSANLGVLLSIQWEVNEISPAERARANELRKKLTSDAWLFRR